MILYRRNYHQLLRTKVSYKQVIYGLKFINEVIQVIEYFEINCYLLNFISSLVKNTYNESFFFFMFLLRTSNQTIGNHHYKEKRKIIKLTSTVDITNFYYEIACEKFMVDLLFI